MVDTETRFWQKVVKTETCWLWLGRIDGGGYGDFWFHGRTTRAHRASYLLAGREIPEGYEVDHLCRVRHCVNPDHLEAVTGRENNLRSQSRTAIQARQTHCKRGHPFDEGNTILEMRPSGYPARICRTCRRVSRRAYAKNYMRKRRALPRLVG